MTARDLPYVYRSGESQSLTATDLPYVYRSGESQSLTARDLPYQRSHSWGFFDEKEKNVFFGGHFVLEDVKREFELNKNRIFG